MKIKAHTRMYNQAILTLPKLSDALTWKLNVYISDIGSISLEIFLSSIFIGGNSHLIKLPATQCLCYKSGDDTWVAT